MFKFNSTLKEMGCEEIDIINCYTQLDKEYVLKLFVFWNKIKEKIDIGRCADEICSCDCKDCIMGKILRKNNYTFCGCSLLMPVCFDANSELENIEFMINLCAQLLKKTKI